MTDPWERIRHLTLDQLVTQVKLVGSGFVVDGFTTPEGWPFLLLLAVGKPGSELSTQLLKQAFMDSMKQAGAPEHRADNPAIPRKVET